MNTTAKTSTSNADPNQATVLIVGATGWLGAKITQEIAASG